ncbi:MAG: trypsin-like peptidase domain-containing protein [Syntrophobacteraceae bacterium]
MKRIFIYSVLAVLLSGAPALAGVWAPEVVGKVRRAVVTIYVFDKTGKQVGQGSGFFFKSCGRLITNYHVLGKASAARVKIFDGRQFAVEAIDAEDKGDDVVEAVVDMPYGAAPCLVPAGALAAPGEPLMVAGSPLGVAGVTSTGKVMAIGEIHGLGKCIVHDARAMHGSSGGPVVNVKGEVIGIERAGIVGRPNVDFAIPVKRLSGLTSCYRELKAPPSSNGSTGQ